MTKNNKRAIVTGASSGIGRETVRLLASQGWRVLAVARRDERLQALQDEFPSLIETHCADITLDESAHKIIEAAKSKLGGIDLLVNNAGASWISPFKDISLEQIDNILNTNVRALMRLCHAAISPLTESRGQIINVASIAAHIPMPSLSIYCASKAAVITFSKVLARELSEDGIRVNVFSPSGTDTEVFESAGGSKPDKNSVAPPAEMAQMLVSMTTFPESLDVAELAMHQRLAPA